MKKKCLALLLTLCLVMGLVPVQASAYRDAPEYLVDYIGMTVNEVADIWGYDYELDDGLIKGGLKPFYYYDYRVPAIFSFLDLHDQGVQTGNEQIELVEAGAGNDSMIMPGLPCALTYPQLLELGLDGDFDESDSTKFYFLRVKNDILVHFIWSGPMIIESEHIEAMDPYTDYPYVEINHLSPEKIEEINEWMGPWEGDDSYWDDDYSDVGDDWYDDDYNDDPQTGTTFTDEWQIDHLGAVLGCVDEGVIGGYPDGSYQPQKPVTRAEMSKMLCYAFYGSHAASGSWTSFQDTSTHWAREYISFCYQEGIVSGVGGNRFNPNGYVTGEQAAKMLLVAMGYDAVENGFIGANWAYNVNELADWEGLYENLYDIDPTDALSRDDTAQMIWNAMQVY